MRVPALAKRLTFNILLAIDMGLNVWPLLGAAGETMSHRIARMREYGGPVPHRVGCVLCKLLTGMFWLYSKRDHCTYALSEQPSLGAEIWRWSR